VVTVCQEPGPQRDFADWRLGFGPVSNSAVDDVLDVLHAQTPTPDLQVDDPHLRMLLAAFRPHPFVAEVSSS